MDMDEGFIVFPLDRVSEWICVRASLYFHGCMSAYMAAPEFAKATPICNVPVGLDAFVAPVRGNDDPRSDS